MKYPHVEKWAGDSTCLPPAEGIASATLLAPRRPESQRSQQPRVPLLALPYSASPSALFRTPEVTQNAASPFLQAGSGPAGGARVRRFGEVALEV